MKNNNTRRSFLRTAGQSLLVAPAAISLVGCSTAKSSTGTASKSSKVKGTEPVVFGTGKAKLNVRDLGAVGDGKTKDTTAIQLALDRCSMLGGGEVFFPAGEYLTGGIDIRSNTLVRLDAGATLTGSPDMADYPVRQVRWEGKWIKGYIGMVSATGAENIGITGTGKIIGSTAVKGRVDRATQMRLPALIEFIDCKNIIVEECFTRNYGMWSIHPTYCKNITFKNVIVNSGADGIDVDSCQQVLIDGCKFDTTDDCISLKSGRGEEGYSILNTTEDVHISNCEFKDATWACIGIGSETSGGVRNVHVEHCNCLAAKTFAIYMKSRPGRGAFIEDIYMNDLDVSGAQGGFLRFNILNSGKQDENPVPGLEGIPTIRNFNFTNIRVKDVPVLVDGSAIHPDKPLDGFVLSNITGTCAKGITLVNIKNAKLSNINVTGFTGPLLSTSNVTGKGLEGAVSVVPPKLEPAIAAPAKPYVLK